MKQLINDTCYKKKQKVKVTFDENGNKIEVV